MEKDGKAPADSLWIISLNEECFFRGRGKVYILGPGCDQPSLDEKKFCKTAFEAFNRVPRFFYIPAAMGEEEREAWTSLGDDTDLKLAYRSPRQIGLPAYTPVLPFDLSMDCEAPQFDPSKTAPVTVCVHGSLTKALVGLTSEFRTVCDLDTGLVLSDSRGWKPFEPWTRIGLHAVVHELDKLYVKHPEHLEFYSTLVDKLIEAGKAAADADEMYGFVPEGPRVEAEREARTERARNSRQWRLELRRRSTRSAVEPTALQR
ncbi:hypothetical protein ABEF95_003819 [Exophiala dermatitidis]